MWHIQVSRAGKIRLLYREKEERQERIPAAGGWVQKNYPRGKRASPKENQTRHAPLPRIKLFDRLMPIERLSVAAYGTERAANPDISEFGSHTRFVSAVVDCEQGGCACPDRSLPPLLRMLLPFRRRLQHRPGRLRSRQLSGRSRSRLRP